MELKVWVEGIQRIVCGVNETTTCQDVVLALAHATGKVGRFTLVERWRNNERLLAPQEFPLKILTKWGEYSNDIQFILRQSDTNKQQSNLTSKPLTNVSQTPPTSSSESAPTGSPGRTGAPQPHVTGSPSGNPVGVVKGVPQRTNQLETPPLKDVPPYREPPPPYRSPPPPSQRKSPSMRPPGPGPGPGPGPELEAVSYNSQYRELVTLVNLQKEKLTSQQAHLIKYDAEIGYWENKNREQERQAELIQQQIHTADAQLRIGSEQVQALTYVEAESSRLQLEERALRAETALWRSKLCECETELTAVRARLHALSRELAAYRPDARSGMERSMLAEMESLQSQIQQAKHATELNHLTAENLKREVGVLESAIMEKKRQTERLVQEMKEANLQSLAGSQDELRHLLDGSCKAGSTRRIIGSPRQLENAAPTNKNPHGVWV